MKRILPLLLSALALVSCGSGDSFTPTADQQALADCTAIDLQHLGLVYGEVLNLFEAIPGAPAGGTYDIVDGDYTLTTPSGAVAGVVSSTDVITDGIDVGESATATWALNGGLAGAPTATGEGSFTIARPSSTTFNVSGNGEVIDGTCDFTFTNLSFTVTAAAGLQGTVLFTVDAPPGTLTGTMTFNGSDTARVVAEFDGVTYTFYIDLVTYEVSF
ncbi:MAG: hypothetical protein L6Q95_05585 [Planctomycetes bacterium]|nr:hypothetical protein [Planctomycetota bacterium]